MYSAITGVTPAEKHTLIVSFEDGQSRLLDMSPFLDFGVFKQIKETDAFNHVHVAFDTIEWECGVDLDPEFVRNKSIPV